MKTTAHTIAAHRVHKDWKAKDRRSHVILRRTRMSLTAVLLGVAVVPLTVPHRASALDCSSWEEKHPDLMPRPRIEHALAYDSARGVTVLFGGYDNDGYVGDTWEWDGAAWTMRGAPGPSPRKEQAQAYDSARGVTVLFGGYDGSKYGDTWEYRGCSGRERLKKPTCLDQQGSNQLKVVLAGGIVGDGVTVALTDGSTVSCFINARGKCRAFFNGRPSGDRGEVVAAWGCGASDQRFYECP